MKKIICFFKGHQQECVRRAVITEKGPIAIHAHICLFCGMLHTYPAVPIQLKEDTTSTKEQENLEWVLETFDDAPGKEQVH